MWLVRFLPFRAVAAIGEAMGSAVFWLIPERRKVTRVNLAKCFPGWSGEKREAIARAHFRAFLRSFIDRGILWWSAPERVEALVQLEGFEHLQALAGQRIVILAPHFLGLDAGGIRLAKQWPRMLQSSQDLRAVQELLGHASIATTQVYTHLDFQALAKVYDAAHPRARKKTAPK